MRELEEQAFRAGVSAEALMDRAGRRLGEARRDVEHGLATTLDHFVSRQQQENALAILQFKLDVFWSMLDAMQLAYHYNEPPYHSC